MPKIIKNGKEYSGVPIEVVTAWAPTADPVQVKEPLMGNTDISAIGDGSITGAIDTLNDGLTTVEDSLSEFDQCYRISSGGTITSNNPRRLSFSATVLGLLYVVGNTDARCGLYILYGTTSSVSVFPVKDATACTITTGTGYFEITSTSGALYGFILTRSGLSRITETAV